jgi:GT2 family glycosyltransferase
VLDWGIDSKPTLDGLAPPISAVVVNFNGSDRILNCLDALSAQTTPLAEIIVVDNGSDDGSPGQIRAWFPKVQILELGENRGLPAARNAGLRLTTTELVLLVDNDVYLVDNCLSYLARAYCNYQPTVICPRICLIPERNIVQADGAAAHFVGTMVLRHGYLPVEDAPAQTVLVDGCIGACLLVDRAKTLAIGGFDETYFFYFEDLEFSIRLRALGHRLICEPSAVAYHDRGLGTPGLSFRGRGTYPPRRAYLTLRHRWLTILIHYRLRTLVVLAPALALYELATLVLALLQGWALQWVRAWMWQLLNSWAIWKRRRWVQQTRLLNDKELLVGGTLPISPGLIRSRIGCLAVTVLSMFLNAYWRIAQRWIG